MIIREITRKDIEIITAMRMQMLDEVTEDPLPEGLESHIRQFVSRHMRDNTCLGVVAEIDGQVVADAVIYLPICHEPIGPDAMILVFWNIES